MECRGLSVWHLVLLCCSAASAHYLRESKNETVSSQVNGTCLYNGTWFQDKEELPTRGLCLVCHCFPGFVEPNAFTCSVIDCPWEDYHKRFPGCTPIYADRDCCPIGWECDYGTQNPGQQLSKDASCDCEWRYLKHYEAKGCRPVYEEKKPENDDKPSCTCPWRFDCSQADEIHADEKACLYKKHIYPIGSKIPTNNPCESCTCATDYFTQAATISCSTTECPAVYSKTPLPEGCHYIYKENQCCPTSVECPTGQKDNIYQVPSCEYKGKMYYEGEQIYPDEDPCLICLCNANWTGPQGESCRQHDCMLERDSRKLKQGCIPIYHEKTCCPIDYHCAEDDFDFKSNRGASFKSDDDEDEMCFFDSRYYPIGHVLDIKYPTNCVTCTCKTPPDFTCIHCSCPPPPNKDYTNCRAVYKPHSCCPNYTCEEKDSKSCPDPICKGTNCWLVKQENGCQICRCKSRCMPCPPMCQPENPLNECSGCICQINSTALFDFENSKKEEKVNDEQEDSLQQLIQECKNMECSTDERCMLVEQKCDNETVNCLPIPKCEKVSFGCGQPSCPEGCQEIGSYENNCPLCYCKDSIQEPQYKLTCRVQSCEENCVLTGRDEGGCPICKCPQGNLEERACASSPCNGFNCTVAVNSLGCVECRCQLSCKPKECPVGCDLDLDVPENSGLECGCQCKNSTTAMEYVHSKAIPETCSPVSCSGLNCSIFEEKSGCPSCQCKAPCPAPVCQVGCQVEKEVTQPGRCPGCVCKLSRSARDNSGKDCPAPICLGYNCSVITVESGCQKCFCESPCEEAPQCPKHCKLETNVPEGRCRGCVCSYGEHLDSDSKPLHRGGGKVPDGPDSEIAPEKREDMDADFIPLPGKDLVPGVDNLFLMHGNLGKDQYTDMPGYHYAGGHAFPVFGEPLESALYNLDDLIPGELESGLPDEAREEVDDEDRHADYHEDTYGDAFAEEKAVNEEDEEKCAQKNCPEGQKCVIRRLQCIRTPCPTIPVCIDVEPRCPIPMCAIGCMVMKWDDEVCPSCFCGIIRGAEGRVCPRTRCAGRRCYNVIGDDGCPQCKCDSICIPPKCYDGCHVEKDPPVGKCATCLCEDRGSVVKPIVSGTSPSPNTTGSNVELWKETEKPEGSKDSSEDIDHSTTSSAYITDTQGRNPSTIGDQISSESELRPEIVDRNKLLSEDFSAEFYNSLAEIEHEVLSQDPTTVTVNLPTTIDAADVFAPTTEPSEIYSDVNIFTSSTEDEVSKDSEPIETTEYQQSTNSLPEEQMTTKKPCMNKPTDSEEEKVNSLNIFDIYEKTKTSTLESVRPYTFPTETQPTHIPTQNFDKRPSVVNLNPISSIPNKNTHNKLKPLRPPTVLQASDNEEDKRPPFTTSSPFSNKNQAFFKPQVGNTYNGEMDEENESMKPILQNLQQLMSNLHHVLSTHQRPDVFQHFGSSVITAAEPQENGIPKGDKIPEKPKVSLDHDLKQSETENQEQVVFSQSIGPIETDKSFEGNSSKVSYDQSEHSGNQEEQNISKFSSESKPVENTTVETQSNVSPQSDAESQQQQYFLNPNVIQSQQHHTLSNHQQIVPSVLHQGVNPQFHLFPQYPYQNPQSSLQALGIMQQQAPYQNHLQSVYAGNRPNPIFSTQQQNPYYTSIQSQPFISNVSPFQAEQYGQSPSQVHKQHVLLTNIPIPPSLQQQLNAGTQTLGFLQQLINHRNNPFYQQQLLQSQIQLQQQMGFPNSDSKPTDKETSKQDTSKQDNSSNNTDDAFNQHAASSDNQQTQDPHQQYVYANNQPLSSQQQFENGEVGSQSYAGAQKPQQQQYVGGLPQQQYIHYQQQQVANSSTSQSSLQQNTASHAMPPFPDSSSPQSGAIVEQFNHHAPQQISGTQSINQSPSIPSFNSQQQPQKQVVQSQSSQQQYAFTEKPLSDEPTQQLHSGVPTVNHQAQEQIINFNNNEKSQQQNNQVNSGSVLQQDESSHQYQVTETKPVQQNVQHSYVNNQYVPQVQENMQQFRPLQGQQQVALNNEQSGQFLQNYQSNLEFNENKVPNDYQQQTDFKPKPQEFQNEQPVSEKNYAINVQNQQHAGYDYIKTTNIPSTGQQQNAHPQSIYNQNSFSQQQAQHQYVPESSSNQPQTIGSIPQSQVLSSYQQQSQNQLIMQNQESQKHFGISENLSTPGLFIQQEASSQYKPIQQQYTVQPIHQNTQQHYISATSQSPQYILNGENIFFDQQDMKNKSDENVYASVLPQKLQQHYGNTNQQPLVQTSQIQQTYIPQPQQTYHQQPQQAYIQHQHPHVQQQLNTPQQQTSIQKQQFQQPYNNQISNIQQTNTQQAYIHQQNVPQNINVQQQNIPQQTNFQQQTTSQHMNIQQQQNINQQQYLPQQQYNSQQQNFPQQQYVPQSQYILQQNPQLQNTPQQNVQNMPQQSMHVLQSTPQNIQQQQQQQQQQQYIPQQNIYHQQNTQQIPGVAQQFSNQRPSSESHVQHQFVSSQSTFAYQSPQTQQQLVQHHYSNKNERPLTQAQELKYQHLTTSQPILSPAQSQEVVQQSNQQQYLISNEQPLKQEIDSLNTENFNIQNEPLQQQFNQQYLGSEDSSAPQQHIEDQILIEPNFSTQHANEEQTHVGLTNVEAQQTQDQIDNAPLSQHHQEIHQHHIEALKPLAQITTAQNPTNQQVQENLSILGPNEAEPIQLVVQDLKYNHSDVQITQSLMQQTEPAFQQEHLPNSYGVKTRPGAIYRPHFAAITSQTSTVPPTSVHDLFPAPSRPINNKPQLQQQDWVDQEFGEDDFNQEFDYDDFDLPESTTYDPFPRRQSVTPPQQPPSVEPQPAHFSDFSQQQQNQYELLENFDNHQPESVKKPLDQQEFVEEFDATTPKKYFFSRTSTTPRPNVHVTANSSNVFASFPTVSPTAEAYSGSKHSTKPPSPLPSYQCPTPHCNGYNCSLIRGSDGCQKCVCDSPCAPCPQHCVKTKTLSEGRCPICDCTVAPTLALAAPTSQCPVVNCRGSNCRKVKDSNGCQTCICDPKCVEPKCDPGCEILRDVPPGQCPGCVCRVTVVQAVVPQKNRQCSSVTCGRNCKETRGPDGCPLCVCNPECPPPKCDVGCQVQTDVAAGECPTCVCPNFADDDDDEDDDLYCPNLFCSEYGCREIPGPAGCPICMCDPICKTPVCEPGCQIISNKYHGRCPVCVCRKPINGTYAAIPSKLEETVKTVPVQQQFQQQEQSPITFSGLIEPVEAEDESTVSTLHTTVTVELNTDLTTEPATEPAATTCPPSVCSGLRCSMETAENGCEVCKCKYKCPTPKCVGHCYAETNAPSHRCPGCVCPQRPKPPKY